MKKILQEYKETHKKISDQCSKIIDYYLKHFNQGRGGLHSFKVYNDKVSIKWDETWAYEGYDCGYFSVPFEIFENGYKEFIDKMVEEDNLKKAKEANALREARIKEAKRVLKELDPNQNIQ